MRGQKVSLRTFSTDEELKINSLVDMQRKINRSQAPDPFVETVKRNTKNKASTKIIETECDNDDNFEVANDVANNYYRRKNGLPILVETRIRPFSPITGTLLGNDEEDRSPTPRRKYLHFPDVKKSKPSYQVNKLVIEPELKTNSVVKQIFNFLLKKKIPVHINEIIAVLNKKKLLNRQSHLHHYTHIHKTLMRNHFFFIKEEKGMFSIRDGFKFVKSSGKKKPAHKKPKIKPAISLSDVIALAISDFEKKAKKRAQLTPSEILALLKANGYSGDYKTVKQSLKPDLFRRRGLKFQLKK
jgi:predicted Zn-ribbon and HTH transcriptional regulator